AGESGAGELRLVPASVRALRVDEPANGALDGWSGLARCVEREQRPRRLRSRRRAASAPARVAVRAEVLAEAAFVVLHALEPAHRCPDALMSRETARGERGNGRRRPV